MDSGTNHKSRPVLRKRTLVLGLTLVLFATAIICGTNYSLYQSDVLERAKGLSDLVDHETQILKSHFDEDIRDLTLAGNTDAKELARTAQHAGLLGAKVEPDISQFAAVRSGKTTDLLLSAGGKFQSVAADSPLKEALGHALDGETGTQVVKISTTEALLVAYAPIPGTNFAWANAVALDTISGPYLRAALGQSLFALAGILGGILFLIQINRSLTEELQNTVTRLSTAQRIGRMGNWDLDVATQKLWWSDEVYRMLGYEPGQVKNQLKVFLDCVHPDDRERVLTAVRETVENSEPYDIRHRIMRVDGQEIVVHEQAEVVYDSTGAAVRMIGTVQDVSDQWKAAEKLDQLHNELEVIFNNSAIGVSFIKGTVIVRANEFYEQMFGCERGQAAGMDSSEFFLNQTEAQEAWTKAVPMLENGQTSVEERLMRKIDGGDPFWCRITGKAVDEEDGEPRSIWVLENISERKLSEEALQLSESRYKLATSGVREAAWDVDLITGELWQSPVWQELTGLSEDDLKSYNWRSHIHPDDVSALETSISNVLDGKTPHFWHEVRHQHQDGRWLWFECRGSVKRDDTGKAVRFSGRVSDVTRRKQAEDALKKAYAGMEDRIQARTEELSRELAERKRAELALKDSEQQLQTLTQLSPVGLYRANRKGNCTYANERYCTIAGRALEEVTGRNWQEDVHPDDRELLMSKWQKSLDTGTSFETENRMISRDGKEVWILGQAIPEKDADGQITSFIGSVIDITERKIAQDMVKRSEERLRMILDNAADGIITINSQGVIQSFNAAAEKIFGYQASEALGRNVKFLMPEPFQSEHDSYLSNYQSTGDAKIIGKGRNVKGLHKDGTEFPLYLAISAPANKEMSIYTGIFRDMTEASLVEQELREATEQAEGANRAKSEFLSRMSHELRTPMNAILGFSQLLELNGGKTLSPDQTEFVQQILMSGRHLLTLINEILDLSKIEAGGMIVDMEDVDPAKVIAESVALIAPAANARDIRVINLTGDGAVPTVRADSTRLKQVMANLLSNAVKYNVEGGSVTVDYIVGDGRLQITVSDTGPGIPAGSQANLFEPFVRLEPANSEIEGAGIGLAITRNLVQLMGGSIGVDSAPGKGSTFSIYMVLAVADEGITRLPSRIISAAEGQNESLPD